MFFKKKESKASSQPEVASTSPEETPVASSPPEKAPVAQNGKPVYQKPVLRRYDQIDQVKPYGPSEI